MFGGIVPVQYKQYITMWEHGLFPVTGELRRVSPLSPAWGRAWARQRIALFFSGIPWQ